MNVVFIPHQGNMSFQEMKTTTEKHNNQNEELYSIMQWVYHTNTFMPKAQKTLLQKRGEKDCKRQRVRECDVILCLLLTPEAIPAISHKYYCHTTTEQG